MMVDTLVAGLLSAKEGSRALSDRVLEACGIGTAHAMRTVDDANPTCSIDDAVALVLEGNIVRIEFEKPETFATVSLVKISGGSSHCRNGATVALALCAVIVEALEGEK